MFSTRRELGVTVCIQGSVVCYWYTSSIPYMAIDEVNKVRLEYSLNYKLYYHSNDTSYVYNERYITKSTMYPLKYTLYYMYSVQYAHIRECRGVGTGGAGVSDPPIQKYGGGG